MNTTTRRGFLLTTGGVVLATALPRLIPAFGGDVANEAGEAAMGANALRRLDEDERAILELASRAPSGHNTQPWTVRIAAPGRWTIGTERSRWLPAVDQGNHDVMLSMGAFMENLVIAAGVYGKRVEYRVIAKSPHDAALIETRITRTEAIACPVDTMRARRTVRNGMNTKELKRGDIDSVTGKHSGFIYIPRLSAEGKYLAEATLEANKAQTWRNEAQEELADWIRWSKREQRRHLNGLTPASMEITGMAGWYVGSFFDRQSVLENGFREQGIALAKKQVDNCGGWLVLQLSGNAPAVLVEAGRAFQRMGLRVREKMIAVHPMTQALQETPWKNEIAARIGVRKIAMLMRVGYVKSYPAPVSLRMPIERFTRA